MIGGMDYVFRLPTCSVETVFDMSLRWARRLWPNAWFETLEMTEPIALASVPSKLWLNGTDEFFVYKDQASATEWTEFGATESNRNRMLYFLIKPRYADGQEDHVEVTIVVGELTPEMRENLQRLQEKLQAEAASRSQWRDRVTT
jgi:hypothetical protein